MEEVRGGIALGERRFSDTMVDGGSFKSRYSKALRNLYRKVKTGRRWSSESRHLERLERRCSAEEGVYVEFQGGCSGVAKSI